MYRFSTLSVILLFIFFSLSCSGSNQAIVTPATTEQQTPVARETSANAYLWGICDIYVDVESRSVDIVPLRGTQLTCNVNRFIDDFSSSLHTEIEYVDAYPDYIDIGVTVGILHPFPGLAVYTGFDVIGVFMGNGGETWIGPEGFAVPGASDQQLLNPDGYTRWFNAPEFTGAGYEMPLQGYSPGELGTPGYEPTAVLCPYKYFADGLDKDDDAFEYLRENQQLRGSFAPGSINHRRYDLRFPNSTGVKFQYAIIAHWKKNLGFPDPPPDLDDFPMAANAAEALVISVVDESTVYFGDASTYGGDVILRITPWDWTAEITGGAVEEYEIFCHSSAWDDGYPVDMTPVIAEQYNYTFEVEIPVEILQSAEPLPVWIEVRYPEFDYTSPLGIENDADGNLAGYFLTHAQVSDEVPEMPSIEVLTPNGGEEWLIGGDYEITWQSQDITGTVFIEYSKDDFLSDVNLITYDELNDGSFMWEGIPDDPSDTVKVRVSSMADSSVNDESDEYFLIIEPPGLTLTAPDGGETWYIGSAEEITWNWSGEISGVKLELSTNSGVGYDTVIVDSTECDGAYTWDPIPDTETGTARVRISVVDDSAVNDESNDDFTIAQLLQGWIPKSDNPLIRQPYQYEVPVDITVYNDGENESRGETIRQGPADMFWKFNDDYSNTTGFWEYKIPPVLVEQDVWIHTIRKFDTSLTGNWLFVTNNDDHPANPIHIVDPMHGAFSGNDNASGEFSHNDWGDFSDMFFFGDTGFYLDNPDPELLPWLYLSDFASGVPGGITGDSSVLFLAPMSHLESDPHGAIALGYWNPPYDEHSSEIWRIMSGSYEGGSGTVDESDPSIMALAVDDDTGLAIYDFEDIITFWVLDSSRIVQAHVLALIPNQALGVLPVDRLDAEEYAGSIPVDIEVVPAKEFGYEITHYNWLAALLDNGDGTWSVGVWEYEYIHEDGSDIGSKFWEVDITDPIQGIPQSLDVDCTDFEIHVLYKKADEYYAVTVFEYIP